MPKTYASHTDPAYSRLTAAGCFEDGEPTFLLRAQDRHAADVVRYWASLVKHENARDLALGIADEMDRWPDRKEPDL